jgi:energy-coupling factor transport system ATP-binding protein
MNPRYIAFDEPTAYLDPTGRRRVLDMMKRLRREGIGVIHITHDVNDMADADRLLVMDQGKLILDGPPREIFRTMMEGGDWGFTMPPIMELMHHLNRRGWPLATDLLSVAEAGREIHQYLLSALKEEVS